MDTMVQGTFQLQRLGGHNAAGCSEAYPMQQGDIGGPNVAIGKGEKGGAEGVALGLGWGYQPNESLVQHTPSRDMVDRASSLIVPSSSFSRLEASECHEQGVCCSPVGSVPGRVTRRVSKGTLASLRPHQVGFQGASSNPDALQAFGTPRRHHRAQSYSHLKGSISEPIGSGKAARTPSSRPTQHVIVSPHYRLDDLSPAASPTASLGMPRASRMLFDSTPQQLWGPRPARSPTAHTALGLASLKAMMKETPANASSETPKGLSLKPEGSLLTSASLMTSATLMTPATPTTPAPLMMSAAPMTSAIPMTKNSLGTARRAEQRTTVQASLHCAVRNMEASLNCGVKSMEASFRCEMKNMEESLHRGAKKDAPGKARAARLHRSFGSTSDFLSASRTPLEHKHWDQGHVSRGTLSPPELEATATSPPLGHPRPMQSSEAPAVSPCAGTRGHPRPVLGSEVAAVALAHGHPRPVIGSPCGSRDASAMASDDQTGAHSDRQHWPLDAWARRKLRGRRRSGSAVLSDFAVAMKREGRGVEEWEKERGGEVGRDGLHSVMRHTLTPGEGMGQVLEQGQRGFAAKRGNVGGIQEPGGQELELRLPLAGVHRSSSLLEAGILDPAADCAAMEKGRREEGNRAHRSRMSLDGVYGGGHRVPYAERSAECELPQAELAAEESKMGHRSRLSQDGALRGGVRSPSADPPELKPPRPSHAREFKGNSRSRLSMDGHYERGFRGHLRGSRLHDHVLGQPYEDVGEHFVMYKKAIGEGQFGVIRKCKEIATGEVYACKSIPKACIRCREDADDLRKEVMCLAMLKHHPTIVTLRRTFEDRDAIHIVMELCGGGDLLDHITAKGPLAEPAAARLCRALVEALLHCHCLGIVHRDVKPENILLAAPGAESDIKLVDFGVATFIEGDKALKDIMGTPEYMAPEVFKKSYSKMADIWSAGVVLYVALSGTPPFWESSKESIVDAILGREVSFEGAKWAPVSEECKDLIGQMLCKDPMQRISATDVLNHPWVQRCVKA